MAIGGIPNDRLEQYIIEKTADLYKISKSDFLYRHINWKSLVEERKQDYGSVEIDGKLYWLRK